MPGTPESNNYMTEFPFFAQYGIGATVQNAVKFMQDVFNNVVNPYVAALREYSSGVGSPGPLIPISLDFSSAIAGTVSPFGAGGFGQGTIWELIKSFGDIGTWNEFFIEDREDAPYAVYRPNPFMDAAGLPIFTFPAGKFPGLAANQVQITRADVVSISAERSDSDVANYFWVDSPRFNLCYEPTMRSMAVLDQTNDPAMGPYVTAYQNVDPQLYGTKKMWEQTQQGGQDETINGNGVAAGAVRDTNQTSFTGWMKARRTDMVRQNRDNVIFERGSMRLKGNESIRAGTYLSYEHGDYTSLYYVVSVEHDYAPFGNFFTSVQFERGTNFMDRVRTKADTDSPYLSEMVDLS